MSATSATCSMRSRPADARCRSALPLSARPTKCRKKSPAWCATRSTRTSIQFADLSRRNIATAPIKTNADGGMHPVFVEAVKKNQIGVAPQEPSFLVSTAPGTIPATVRPPRIPELAECASGRRHRLDASHPGRGRADPDGHCRDQTHCPAGRQVERRQPVRQPVRLQTGRSQAADKATARSIAWPAWSACAATTAKPRKRKPPPAPKPKPAAAKPTSVASHGAIRARQAEAQPVKTTEAQAPAAPAAAAPAQTAVAAPASTAMSGAAPVVQTGNFDSRWSGFR